ncbi:MAG: hypothetical protein AAGE96_22915 [Cyanobacteria bacterium P01_G01_bin.19]
MPTPEGDRSGKCFNNDYSRRRRQDVKLRFTSLRSRRWRICAVYALGSFAAVPDVHPIG